MSDLIVYPIVISRHVPKFVRDSTFMAAIYKVEDKALAEALWDINRLYGSGFLDTIDDPLLSALEQWWRLPVSQGATLADRRIALRAKMASKTIYTKRALYRMLEALCGADGFELTIDTANLHVKVLVDLRSAHQENTVKLLLYDVLPANMTFDVQLRYNTHGLLHNLTHGELAKYTHKELRSSMVVREEALAKGE